MEKKKEMNIVVAVVICLAVLGVLIFISINNKVNMDTTNVNDNVPSNTGEATAQSGDMVAMNYTGRLKDGTVFDSNVDPKFNHVEPFVFPLGAGRVIAGWDKGIVGMKVGEKKTLTIPPEDAYGANGIPGVIPPNATLIFEVELLAINNQ
jgi:FKBP-type peptidyl-prolyl cis-trans isomerase